MQLLSIDLAAMPQDDAGYRYILLIGEMLSKYCEAEPLQNQSAKEVVDALCQMLTVKLSGNFVRRIRLRRGHHF